MLPRCPWPNHPSTLPACPSLFCTPVFNPILNAALKCACWHLFYSWWVLELCSPSNTSAGKQVKTQGEFSSHFTATPKEDKLTLKPRKETNAAQAQPEKLHDLPAQQGRRSPQSLSPTRSARQLTFTPFSVIHSRKALLGKAKLFCLSSGGLVAGLSAKDLLGDTVPLSSCPLGEII